MFIYKYILLLTTGTCAHVQLNIHESRVKKDLGLSTEDVAEMSKEFHVSAATPYTAVFDQSMARLRIKTLKGHDYVMSVQKERWALAHIPFPTFGELTSNPAGE
jgi:hypothetical protein